MNHIKKKIKKKRLQDEPLKAITFDIRGRLSGYKGVKIPIKNSLLIMQNSLSVLAWMCGL